MAKLPAKNIRDVYIWHDCRCIANTLQIQMYVHVRTPSEQLLIEIYVFLHWKHPSEMSIYTYKKEYTQYYLPIACVPVPLTLYTCTCTYIHFKSHR